jgi:hypothetical protein
VSESAKAPRPKTREVPTPVKQEVHDWIQRTGYPLELRVARALRECGFERVGVSEYYNDPVTDRERECDVRGSFPVQVSHGTDGQARRSVRVTVVVECKYIRKNPWIVLVADRDINVRTLVSGFPVSRGGGRVLDIVFSDADDSEQFLGLFPIEIGHRVVPYVAGSEAQQPKAEETPNERRPTKEQVAFYALQHAIRSSISRASSTEATEELAELVIPTVVVEGDLYEFQLKGSRSSRLRAVNQSTVVQTAWGPPRRVTLVQVLRWEAFAQFARGLVTGWRKIITDRAPEVDAALIDEERQRTTE